MSRPFATLLGFGAVLLWALLALFTAATGDVPPLQLLAMCFAIGGISGLLAGLPRRGWRAWAQPWPAWALGVGGLFGYHLLYVLALRNAEPVEAGLIAYLWPLLIVLMASGRALKAHHLAGALMGLAGAALIVTGGVGIEIAAEDVAGYAFAGAAALVWSSYSVLSRRFATVPTDAVTGFCLVTALLSGLAHLALETTAMPGGTEWLAILGLGLGPVGLAFFLWDIGVKHGDLPVLGAASYAAPLLSTLVLIAAGQAEPGWPVALACLLITGGAVLAAKDMLRGRRR
ncbi:DMT family transporter [Jannaschia seohaensis]|uniref:EamA domain-containing membrane protein RarD n=1 Tax=Jannaschia seohaensis TaxID=475081 RepID=A0A2Y9A4Q5_9RHOB|nr:EamA family transporter [Jannaschia seohaensis]PWJ22160.1 EamA domain-containing membrane protein RarD [Jannaschia seohaensis]SSA38438.1 EamA domain-containing membrane protein RarD [Jannaschia seohaensis]